MNLSFFARKSYPHRRDHHLMFGSSIIRAEQIADYLGAKINPVSGYENDVCVYVKPRLEADGALCKNSNNKTYLDIIDHHIYTQWLREHPERKGIVSSRYGYDNLKGEMPGRIVFIPQQHCNFERFKRTREAVTTVGIIGTSGAFEYPIDETRRRLESIGLRLMVNSDFQTREDVVNFYKNIDIQIVWYVRSHFFKTPLKIINAASFGIPTVAYPHRGYKEVDGYYIKAQTIDQLISEVEKLKNPENYAVATKNLVEMAEKYHISKIAEMYRDLMIKN